MQGPRAIGEVDIHEIVEELLMKEEDQDDDTASFN